MGSASPRALCALALALSIPAAAWEISGKVTTRPGAPLAQAQVCVQGSPSQCVASADNGTFTLRGTADGIEPGPAGGGFSLGLRAGVFHLYSERPLRARIAWIDAAGENGSEETILLSAGTNRLEPPASLRGPGIRFLRLVSGDTRLTWRILMGGLVDFAAFPLRENRALPKSAADMPVIVATKAGYKSRAYYAIEAPRDTLAWILLATDADDSTYKAGGSSYPVSAVPPHETIGRTEFWNCAHCYGGKKAAQVLGHSATGKGSFQFNKIYAPADGNYDITWSYYCGTSDNNGDTDCGGDKTILTKSGCRPGIFVVNGVELPKVNQFKCFPDTWNNVHYATFSVPLKAGNNNSLKIYSKSADAPHFDRIIVPDGR